MNDVKCRGCGDQEEIPKNYDDCAVGVIAKRLGWSWIPSDEGSPWLCRKCSEGLLGLLTDVQNLVGDLYIYPPTAQDMLRQYLENPKKRKTRKS